VQTYAITDSRAELILELTQLALAAPSIPDAVSPMLNRLVEQTAAEDSAYFQASGVAFYARAASGVMPDGPIMESILTHGLPGETPLMVSLRAADGPLFFDDTQVAPETAGFPDLGVMGIAAAPVRSVSGELLGAFPMHTFDRHAWTDREAELFATMSGIVASLTARLVAEERAVGAQEDAIRALGLALEYRDGEVKGHTDRVTMLALDIAREMQLEAADVNSLRWGAYLHDIGKIAIPDAILRKPAKLDDVEWETMRTHSAVGHTFAAQLSFVPTGTLEVIRYHHERWDGRGYPEGRFGNDIPIGARIFAVCDVYDALVSERPYKRAWSHDEAIQEITSQAAGQFDPEVVSAFLRAINSVTHAA